MAKSSVGSVLIPVAATGVMFAVVLGIFFGSQTEPDSASEDVDMAAIESDVPIGPAIAVLPFLIRENSSVAPGVANNLADQITKNLMDAEGLAVSPKNKVAIYSNGVRPSLGEMSYELRVRYIFQAMLYGEDNEVRVDARLDDGMTGYTLWTGSFWAERLTLFDLHTEISNSILSEIGMADAAPTN
jgi:TolB-like protein